MAKKKMPTFRVHVEVDVAIDHAQWAFEHGDDSISLGRDGSITLKFDVEAPTKADAETKAAAIVGQKYPNAVGHMSVVRAWSPTTSEKYVKEKRPGV